MIKLNDNNIIVGQIKQLLHTFPLPQCQIGSLYPSPNTHFLLRDHIKRWDENLNVVNCDHYVFGNDYLNLTATLPIRNTVYDRETHRYLGKYLRFLRDYCNLNLMSMYNCCDGDVNTNKLSFKLPDNRGGENELSFINGADSCTVYKIPISISPFTISSHSTDTLEICVYVNNLREEYSEIISHIAKSTYIKRKTTSVIYYSPFAKIKDESISKFIMKHLHELCLLIKVTNGLDTSLTVLEGTYIDKPKFYEKYYSYRPIIIETGDTANTSLLARVENATSAAQDDTLYQELVANLNEVLLVRNAAKIPYKQDDEDFMDCFDDACDSGFNITPQLLSFSNTESSGLLADRLIEYLTGNVITQISESYEIKRLQKTLNSIRIPNSTIPNIEYYQKRYQNVITSPEISKKHNRYLGIWHNQDYQDIKAIAYASKAMQEYDTIGYLDKTLETQLKGVLDNVNI